MTAFSISSTVLHKTRCTVNMLHHVIQSISTKNRPKCSVRRGELHCGCFILQVLVSVWETKIFPSDSLHQWKGRKLTYIDVCSLSPLPPSSELHSCCCYVMSVCYETLHWKTRDPWSSSSECVLVHTHIQALGIVCVWANINVVLKSGQRRLYFLLHTVCVCVCAYTTN